MQSIQLSVPSEHLSSALESMKARDPIYTDLINEVDSLIKLKTLTLVKVNSLHSQVDNYLNEINLINENITKEAKDINSNIDVNQIEYIDYLDKLESIIWDKIDKYYYFYIKAYEYFSLEHYSGQRDLFFIKQQTKNIKYQKDVLEVLKKSINEQCEDLFESGIYDFKPISAPKTVAYKLSNEQLQEFRERDSLVINLCRENDLTNKINIRILSIEIPNLKEIYKGTKEENDLSVASILFRFKHNGLSEISLKNKNYLFNHYTYFTQDSIAYDIEYDINGEHVRTFPINFDAISTSFMVKNKTFIKEFFMPGACTDILLIKTKNDKRIKEIINYDNFLINFILVYEN